MWRLLCLLEVVKKLLKYFQISVETKKQGRSNTFFTKANTFSVVPRVGGSRRLHYAKTAASTAAFAFHYRFPSLPRHGQNFRGGAFYFSRQPVCPLQAPSSGRFYTTPEFSS